MLKLQLYIIKNICMRLAIISFLVLLTGAAMGQKTDKKLLKMVNNLLQGYRGQAGVYVYDLKKNRSIAINADTVFTTASMVKIPILVGVMDKLNKGTLQYNQELIYNDSFLYAGVDILGSFKNDEKIELSKVLMLMLTTSDNTASLWLQSLAGTGTRINELMDSLGFKHTRVNSKTPGREAQRTRYGWGQTTPKEMATLMKQIAEGTLFNPEASGKMLRMLGRNYWDENAVSQIPPNVFVASKNGAVDKSRSEVLYVKGQHCEYVFCICTQNNTDTSWQFTNEAWVLTRQLSKLLWEYYN